MFFQLLFLCPFFDTDSEYIFGIASESKPNDQGLTQSGTDTISCFLHACIELSAFSLLSFIHFIKLVTI